MESPLPEALAPRDPAAPYPHALQCRDGHVVYTVVAQEAVRVAADAARAAAEAEEEEEPPKNDRTTAAVREQVARALEVVYDANGTAPYPAASPDPDVQRHRLDLWHAACDGDVEVLLQYIQADTDLNAVGQPDPSQYRGAQFEKKWHFRAAPLVFAAAFGRELAVKALLEAGADPAVPSSTGARAVDYARRRGYGTIASMLEQYGQG